MIWTGSAGQGGEPRTNVPSADHPCYSPPQSHPSFSTMPVRRSGIGWPIQPNADCVDLLWNATSQDQSHQNAINPCSPLILKIWPNYCAFTGGDAELHSLETIVTDILNFEKPESETPTNILAERSSGSTRRYSSDEVADIIRLGLLNHRGEPNTAVDYDELISIGRKLA